MWLRWLGRDVVCFGVENVRVDRRGSPRTQPCQGWGRGFESLRPLQVSSGKSERYERAAERRPFAFQRWCPHGVHRDVEALTNPLCGKRPKISWSSESSDCRLGSRSGPGRVFRSSAIGAGGERRRPNRRFNKRLRTFLHDNYPYGASGSNLGPGPVNSDRPVAPSAGCQIFWL
jgi:hypothetical protein